MHYKKKKKKEASKILGVQPGYDSSVTEQLRIQFAKVDFTILEVNRVLPQSELI